jgi:hypothetical protein
VAGVGEVGDGAGSSGSNTGGGEQAHAGDRHQQLASRSLGGNASQFTLESGNPGFERPDLLEQGLQNRPKQVRKIVAIIDDGPSDYLEPGASADRNVRLTKKRSN